MTGVYASGTEVSSDRSRAEIERTLQRYGATAFVSGWDGRRAVLGFVVHDRQVRFTLNLPDPADDEFTLTPSGKWSRTDKQARDAYEQAVRQRWRALALVVKAKLEAVAAGIVTFDEEFLAHLVLPGGQTVGEEITPRLQVALESGSTLALLPAGARDA